MAEAEQPGVDVDALIEEERTQLEEEREKHRKRAEKFGVDYRDPGRRREFRDDARKERLDPSRGFATGFDLFTEEEVEKRQQRAERFNMPSAGLQWQPPEVPEDEEKRRARAERFGVDYEAPDETGLMDVDLYEARREAPAEVERRPEAVHVYGVDLMSTGDVLKYFTDYGPIFVEWLNDSSANVLFKDAATAKRSIAGLGKPLPPEDLPEGVEVSDPANIEYLWHKGEDFMKSGSNIPLIFRMATVLDVKASERVQSRRLWVGAGGRGGDRGRGRGQRKFHRVRRSAEGVAQQAVRRSRAPPGWQHDDRFEDLGVDGDQEIRGRGQRRFKRQSEGGGDADMGEGGPARRQRGGHQQPQMAPPMPERETVSYDDL